MEKPEYKDSSSLLGVVTLYWVNVIKLECLPITSNLTVKL